MTTWNYRVFRVVGGKGTTHYYTYTIGEVYYDDGGKVKSWAQVNDPCAPVGDTPDELRRDLALMKKALALPVMEERKGKLVEVEKPVSKTGKARSK